MNRKSVTKGMSMYLSLVFMCVLIGMVYFVFEPQWLEIKQLTPVEVSEDKNNINIAPTVDDYDDWKIIYDEKILRAEVNDIHDSNYIVREGDTCRKSIPDFILVGVGKCGTRELIDSLSIHPNIITKINPYILRHTDRQNVIDEMPCKYHDQLSGFKRDDGLDRPLLADEIYKLNPNIKIMAIVREPVSRMISSLTFISRPGKRATTLNSNDINTYAKKVIKETVYHNNPDNLVKRSTYDVGIASYLKRFKRDQVLVIESKEFQKNPVDVLRTVERFLGISSFISDQHFAFNREKQFYCIRKACTVSKTMVCYQSNRGRKHIELNKEDKERIANYFRPHNENLFRLIGKRFDW